MLKKLFVTVCLVLTTSASFAHETLHDEQLTEINSRVTQLIEGICVEELDECEVFWAKIIENLENGKPVIYDGGDIDYGPGYGPDASLRLRPEPIDNPDFRADKNERARDARKETEDRITKEVVEKVIIPIIKKKLGL